MNKKQIAMLLTIAAMTGTGCSTKSSDIPVTSNDEPVQLVLYQRGANISDEEVQALIVEPVKKKYPNISITLVRTDTTNTPQTLVANDNLPDIVFGSPDVIRQFKELNALEDLTSLVKLNNVDLNAFEPTAVETIRAYGDQGQLYAIPFSINFPALFYNKDLFDKFGVPYPKDGMTWEETTELAKKMTRMENGQQYYGLHPAGVDRMAGQLSLSTYNPTTKKATLTGDEWIHIFKEHKAIWDIPGNKPGNNIKTFEVDRTLAMMAAMGARLGEFEELHNQGNPMNWDMVSHPTFPEAPRIGAELDVHVLMLTTTGKNKDTAFKVLQVVTDVTNQHEMNKRGRLTSLTDPKAKQDFGVNLKSLKGRNIDAIFYNKNGVRRGIDKYSQIASTQIGPAMNQKVLANNVDIITALREAEELANKEIEKELANSK
ncbi:carbohydrate ABC transporter substrate-binding protein [Paenibacillus sp. H1-7]|uniref:ABC transporter substrate-binding protein n=1 Tax=Paenibacillus sp. H1-7 TaxID=2282849 RepID=UPI001EF7696C|nr:ABC transporter substrate-binding protein [Paenibacillus sp. H1-7]ULL16555.1 carbohydrate ABC transporter substrate-binding protein [Paenibacillus sp. H1-7]